MKRKDPDQEMVYYAESLVFDNTLFAEALTDEALWELSELLFGSDWWQSNKFPTPDLCHREFGTTYSLATTYDPRSGRSPEIWFAPGQVNVWTLVHEAGHIAQYHVNDIRYSKKMEAHGREFRDLYLSVADIMFGYNTSCDLRDSFTQHILPRKSNPIVSPWHPDAGSDPEGLYQKWRIRKQVEDIRNLDFHTSSRIGGAIAL